jgi:hypothetical protein
MPQITGRNPDFLADCKNCGAEMSFRQDEVRPGEPVPGSEDGEHYNVVTCPECKKPVRVKGYTSAETAARQREEELRRDYDNL